MKRLAAVAVMVLVLLAPAAPALAHAELLRATPEPNASLDRAPALIELYFGEALEGSFSNISALNANGAPVDNGDARVDPADPTRLTVSLRSLPDGIYTVAWKALSAVDGHVTSGSYPFAVGNVDAAALAAAEQASRQVRLSLGEVVARWLTYLSAAMLVGGVLFAVAVWQPAASAPGAEAGELPVRWLGALAAATLSVASLLALLVQAGQASGTELAPPWAPAVGGVLFHTRFGALWLARLALLLGIVGLALGRRRPGELRLALGGGALLLLTLSLGSHAAAEPRPLLPVVADWLHLAAASVWVGGLTHFAAGMWSLHSRRASGGEGAAPFTAVLVPRFSALALTSVATLALTGTYLAVLRLGSWEALSGTLYGRALLAKLALAAPMLLMGAVNLLWVTPRLRLAARERRPTNVVDRFRQIVTSEVTLGAAVLLAAGLFTSLPPARSAATAPEIRRTATADDLQVTLIITPGRVGLNTFTVKATAGGQPVIGAKEVALRFTPATANVAPSEVKLAEQGGGVYGIKGAYLGLPDTWQVQAVVRRQDKFDAYANFDLALAGTNASVFPWNRLNGGLLLLSALLLLFALSALPRFARQPLAPRSLAPALALFAAGLFVFYQPQPGPKPGVVNPIPPNPTSVAAGQGLYQENCLPCHGPAGKGDGPVGLTLNRGRRTCRCTPCRASTPMGSFSTGSATAFPGRSCRRSRRC